MTVRFSTGLRDKLNGMKGFTKGAIVGTGIDFVDGAGGVDTITDSGNGFITANFCPNDKIFIQGSTSNDPSSGAVIQTVVAGTLGFLTGVLVGTEIGLAGTVISVAEGGSLKDIMKDGKLMIFTGSVPDPDDGQGTSTLLLTITESSLAWGAGEFANGLEFEDDPLLGVLSKMASETWSGVGAASGVAGWFMFVANPTDALGSSTTLPRIVGSVGLSTADLVVPSTSIVSGRTYTIDQFDLTLPEYYGA